MTTGDRIASSSRQINRSLERGAGRRQTTTHHPRPGPIDRGPVWPPRRSFAHGHHSNAAPGRPARNRREAGTWKMLRPWPEVQHRPRPGESSGVVACVCLALPVRVPSDTNGHAAIESATGPWSIQSRRLGNAGSRNRAGFRIQRATGSRRSTTRDRRFVR